MSSIKKIKSEEISGSTFQSRNLTFNGDISNYTFTAKVKSPFQGKITEIAGIKNADKVFFSFESIKDLRNGKYIIEYWGDFAELGNEPFLVEELSIVSAENSTNISSELSEVFEIVIQDVSIPISISKTITQIVLDFDSLTEEQKAQIKGLDGKSAYEIAVANGFNGTKSQWLLSLNGERGEKGDTGEKGEKGDKGDTGATGLQGIQGIQGVKGDKGEKGDKGDTGDKGEQGIQGVKGDTGPKGSDASVTKENISAALGFTPTKPLNIKITTPSNWVTGTTSEVEVLRIEIPANSLSDSDVLRMPFLMINKVGTNGTIQIRGKLSTSQTMPSGVTDQIFQTAIAAATNQFIGLERSFIIDDGKIKGFPSTIPSYTISTISSNPILQKPFNRTVTNYLYVSIVLANSADQSRLEGMQLTNN